MDYILFEKFDGNYWNPYNYEDNIFTNKDTFIENIKNKLEPYIENNIINILGPCNINNDRYIIKFNIEINYDDIFFKLYTKSRGNEYNNLKIKNNTKKIIGEQYLSLELSELEKNDYYSGSDFINLCKMIAINLGFNNIECVDDSKIFCSKRNTIFTKKNEFGKNYSFPLRFISLIKNRKTYYQKYNFDPYENYYIKNRFSNKKFDNIINKKNELINLINKIFINNKWNDYFDFFKSIKNFNNKDYEKYFKVLENIYNQLYSLFGKKAENVFIAYKYMNDDNCNLFIDWLEIFHITYTNYKNISNNFYLKIPNYELFKEIEIFLNKVRWICVNIDL